MRRAKNPFWVVIVVGSLGLAPGDPAAGDDLGNFERLEQLQTTLASVAERVAPTVVAIRAEKRVVINSPALSSRQQADGTPFPRERRDRVVGSGVIIRSDGVILTNEHVVEKAAPEDITCTLANGDTYTVKSVISDHRSDLAVLRIDAENLPEARLGDLKNVRQGHFAVVMGNPFGLAAEGKPAMSFGIISALGRALTHQLSPLNLSERYYGNLIETDATINLGNSGGPLLNIRGEVIGITTAVSSRSGGSEGVGYAIPLDARTKSIIAQLVRGEEVEYGYLGIRLDTPTSEERRLAGVAPGQGVLIREVEENTPAAQAKLESGDIVVEFEGEPIKDIDQLIRLVGPVAIVFVRDGVRRTVMVSPARRDVGKGINYQPPMGWRGLTLADITPDLREQYDIDDDVSGVVITALDEAVVNRIEAPVRDEIQEGVVVTQVNGTPVSSLYEFKKQTAGQSGAVTVSLVARDLAIDVTLPPEISAR